MKARGVSWFGMLSALALAGCVQIDSALNVSPDGSGRLHLAYSMPAKESDRMQEIGTLSAQLDKAAGREGAAATDPDLENPFPFEESAVRRALKAALGRGVTIAPNAVVGENVTIGDRAVVGQGAVILKDLGAGEIHVGNPGRLLKKR